MLFATKIYFLGLPALLTVVLITFTIKRRAINLNRIFGFSASPRGVLWILCQEEVIFFWDVWKGFPRSVDTVLFHMIEESHTCEERAHTGELFAKWITVITLPSPSPTNSLIVERNFKIIILHLFGAIKPAVLCLQSSNIENCYNNLHSFIIFIFIYWVIVGEWAY